VIAKSNQVSLIFIQSMLAAMHKTYINPLAVFLDLVDALRPQQLYQLPGITIFHPNHVIKAKPNPAIEQTFLPRHVTTSSNSTKNHEGNHDYY
jgi:hypothetical protein